MNKTSTPTPRLPVAGHLPGVTFRTYAGEADLPGIAGLMRACNAANGVTRDDSADSMRLRFEAMVRVDPHEDGVLGFAGERLVSFSTLTWDDTTSGERHYRSNGWVHPEWRRHGIGDAMWERNERRTDEMAAAHAAVATRIAVAVLPDGDVGGLKLAALRGYRRVRVYHHLVRPDLERIEVTPLPESLELRPITAALLPNLWQAANEAFEDHFGAEDTSEAAYQRWIRSPLLDLDLLAVAFDGDKIAGAVHGVIDPGENEQQGYLRGWTDPIYVRRRWRRRGLASALIGHTLTSLRSAGMTSAQLEVDSQNADSALALYQRHGFEIDRSASEWHKPLGE